jgi:PhnB protein
MLACTPFLLFDGNCAEAMTFYQQCLGGELTLTRLSETPMKAQFPVEKHQRLINARLKAGAVDLSASDWMAAPALEPKPGNTFAIYVTGETEAELKTVFDKLAAGANPDWLQELHEMPFGVYGQLFDKYGIQWIFRGEKKA